MTAFRIFVPARGALLTATLLVIAGCRGLPDQRAEALVRNYNEKLIEAYRMSDERIVEGLVGEDEAKKILGLIGVKADMGITLDGTLTEFRMTGIQRPSEETVDVLTEERWHYRDRKIGTGETVGEESDDHYFMRYTLARAKGSWIVSSVAFERPPKVGRSMAPNRAPARILHGMTAPVPPAQPPASPAGSEKPGRQ